MKNNVYAVILAGGAGTRFWPKSRQSLPKQFLNIIGGTSLFKQAIDRMKTKIPSEQIMIVSNKRYKRLIDKDIFGLNIKKENILLEPSPKNTAPAIYWAAVRTLKKDPNAIMIVFPSDHYIEKKQKFLKILENAVCLAQKDYLVTLGVTPTRPETGYGYIKGKSLKEKGRKIFTVEKFTEKPDLMTAQQFVKSGNYYWNSGMFIFKVATILAAFKKYLPAVCDVERRWALLPAVSIDYGILEKAKNVAVIPTGNIGWSDVGSWEALMDILPKNKQGNIIKGNAVAMDCENTFILSDKRLVAVVGLKNMIVVDTGDAVLVCPKEKSQDVKEVINVFSKSKGCKQYF
ncbi:MAG TPA: mannose-1-phosphate guanylyltransferase [Candidatus Omnitrophota bacterium]|nr:mannose-1-phosphate guanylyltransferase [Candidatus Omnitrophota bacterium]